MKHLQKYNCYAYKNRPTFIEIPSNDHYYLTYNKSISHCWCVCAFMCLCAYALMCLRVLLCVYARIKLLFVVSALTGQQKLLPPSNISLMRVSIGVLPISLIKNKFSTAAGFMSFRAGMRSSRRPALPGWLLYWIRSYSSSDAWVFSCKFCTVPGSCSPGTSGKYMTQNLSHLII